MPTTLITGATGFLGREVLVALLAEDPSCRVIALVRAADDVVLARRHAELVRPLPSHVAAAVEALRGDASEPRLGLGASAYDALCECVDRVLHVAASTRFDLPLSEARRCNVLSTEAVLDLCRQVRRRGREGRLDHVSTAYVAGCRTGCVLEDDWERPAAFRNSYEQSKYEAEDLCRAARSELPIAIHRPSIVVGSSATGSTTRYHGFYEVFASVVRVYGPWKTLLTRLIPLPFDPRCVVDIVPVDYVAQAIATLSRSPAATGRCFHLAAGPEGASTVDGLVEHVCAHFQVRPPRYLGNGMLARVGSTVAGGIASVAAPRLRRRARMLLPYARENPVFDTSNARAMGLTPPPVSEYLARVLNYAQAHDFGAPSVPPVDRAASLRARSGAHAS